MTPAPIPTGDARHATAADQLHPAGAGGDELPVGTVDVVVIGGGAAGLNGALMLARSRRSVVVIDAGSPRNAPAQGIHGLLGNEGTPPGEYLERGRGELRQYGGVIVTGEVSTARATEPAAGGDLRFRVDLADGRGLTARRLLIASGARDELPEVPGLAAHWGRGVVHCPYCHGWEVRDQPIGVIATRPASLHQALMFRQLSDDVVVFAAGVEIDEEARERCAARGIRILEEPIEEILDGPEGTIAGVRLAGGEVVARTTLAVATVMSPRTEGLEGLGLRLEDVGGGMGQKIVSGFAGAAEVPGVWIAGNAADPSAQVGASAAGGALAGGHINGMLVMADAESAVAAQREAAVV
ncbi:NAD(P)/FAD-dependent oxidoreductase [Brachybacterium sacelli]|uniref:Thioredoxin reductase n=2 Tax=Brachybacterium sacelli TaxID=173364 RepID=A0ABS4WYQ0_9MICO|nr:NAD(P)/FAD-dependent oxidoreductase [Brachybacterium sacelli]MBP2381256.1 thioredoxin reductase [Brachybacterium sacelli]